MAVSGGITGVYTNYPAKFEYATSTFLTLTQMLDSGINFGSQIGHRFYGGSVDRIAAGLRSAEPRVSMRTGDLDSLFATPVAMTFDGLCVQVDAQISHIERVDCGTFRATTLVQHPQFHAPGGGFLYVERIIADQSAEEGVQASLMFVPHWNGTTTEPLFLAPLQAIDGVAPPAFNSMFWPGPVRWGNNQELPGVLSWEIDAGIQYGLKIENGEPFGRVGSIKRREFTVRVRTTNISSSKVHPQTSAPPTPNIWFADEVKKMSAAVLSSIGAPAIDLYCRKGINCGIRSADASSVHMKFSLPLACGSVDDISASGNEDGSITYSFLCLGPPTVGDGVVIPPATAGTDLT